MLKPVEKPIKNNRLNYYSKKQKNKKKYIVKRLRKIYKKFNYKFNIYFNEIIQFLKNKILNVQKICLRVTPNNVFCTLSRNKKTILISSTGKYKIKTSKKKLKFTSKIILKSFLKEIKNKIKTSNILLNIIAPKNLRKLIIDLFLKVLKNKSIIVNIQNKKAFNGCRPKKQKRKKRKGLRLFKF
jgi:ribosomal protein S11